MVVTLHKNIIMSYLFLIITKNVNVIYSFGIDIFNLNLTLVLVAMKTNKLLAIFYSMRYSIKIQELILANALFFCHIFLRY